MSQPQHPFQPQFAPTPFYGAPMAFSPPALRRAGVLLICLGVLASLGASCLGVVAWTLPIDQLLAKANVKMPEAPPGYTIEEIAKFFYTMVAVCGLLYGVSLIILGVFVRRGSRGASIAAIVLLAPGMLFLLCNLGSVPMQAGGNPMMLATGACVVGIPIAMCIFACVWLIQGMRQITENQYAQQQYQMQMWQYQQQQAAYQQQPQIAPQLSPTPNDPWQRGYGLTPPPPPPNQPPPP